MVVQEKMSVLTCSLYSLISASSEATSLLMIRFGQDSSKVRRVVTRRPFGLDDDEKVVECFCSMLRVLSK